MGKENDGTWIRDAVEKNAADLTRYAHSLVHDFEAARDAVQETFLRLMSEPRDKVEDHLRPWLFRVCRSRVIDRQRKEKRMQPLDEIALERTAGPVATPAVAMEEAESASAVLALVNALPPLQREMIRLKFQQDLSYREIAEVTGRTVTNVGVTIHKAIQNRQKRLDIIKVQTCSRLIQQV